MAPEDQDLFGALKYHVVVSAITGVRKYYNNAGVLHREEGPAIITGQGSAFWYQNGRLHRTDGPAIEWSDGRKEWWVNDQLHRIDGPALTRYDGTPEWWIYGVKYTEQAYRAQLKTLGIAHDF